MKVTRKIPALLVHLVETADCKAAEPAASEQPPPPSSGRTRNKRRVGSGGNQDKPMEESEEQPQASACPEAEGVAQLAEPKLESQGLKTAKGGERRGKKRHGSFPEAEKLLQQQNEHSRTMSDTQGNPHNITPS